MSQLHLNNELISGLIFILFSDPLNHGHSDYAKAQRNRIKFSFGNENEKITEVKL